MKNEERDEWADWVVSIMNHLARENWNLIEWSKSQSDITNAPEIMNLFVWNKWEECAKKFCNKDFSIKDVDILLNRAVKDKNVLSKTVDIFLKFLSNWEKYVDKNGEEPPKAMNRHNIIEGLF